MGRELDTRRATLAVEALAGQDLVQRVVAAAVGARGGPWLVGGALRDLVLGRTPAGLDVLTTASVASVGPGLARELQASFELTNRDWRMATLRLRDGLVTLTGLAPGDSLETDLARRDYTANAMAVDLPGLFAVPRRGVLDARGGVADLAEGVLRPCTWDGILTDPSRILRGVRLEIDCELAMPSMVGARVRAGDPRELHEGDGPFWDELAGLARRGTAALVRLVDLGVIERVLRLPGTPADEDARWRLQEFDRVVDPMAWPRDEQRRRLGLLQGHRDGLGRLALILGLDGADPARLVPELRRRGAPEPLVGSCADLAGRCRGLRDRGYPWRDESSPRDDDDALAALVLASVGLVACRRGDPSVPAGPEPQALVRRSLLRAAALG